MTFIHINRMLQQYGCINFPFANHTKTEFIFECIKKFGINCMTGVGSYMLQLVRDFEKFGYEKINIQKIYYGAEHLFEVDKNEIRKRITAPIIKAPGYGTIDTWYIGYQCNHCEDAIFHVHDDQVYMEIIDENTNEGCKKEKAGMIYVTPFLRKLTPILRYRVGDRGKWINKECPCGRKTPLFKLLGRGDDILRIGCDSVYYEDIQKCAAKIPGLSGTIQIEKRRENSKDRLIIRVETDKTCDTDLAIKFEKAILDSRQLLSEQISLGAVLPIKIELMNLGTIEKNIKTGKLIRVIQKDE